MDFETDHKSERQFITLEKSAINITVNSVSHDSDDVVDTVSNDLSLCTVVNTVVEEIEELLEGRVVHPVDEGCFHNAEVENSSTRGDGSVLLTLLTDLMSLLFRFEKLLLDLLRLALDFSKHINELCVIEQVAVTRGESLQKLVFCISKDLGVLLHILLQLSQLLFE